MKTVFIIGVALLVAGCAAQPRTCPPLPTMGANELLKDYTLKVVEMYNKCRDTK